MRIIGGGAKGRRIHLPKGCQARPTSDRIKEMLFNIIQPVREKYFLDLFAGSGNVGLEALSRGAAKVVFIEKNSSLVNTIRKHVEDFGFIDRCEIIMADAMRSIRYLGSRGDTYDILFVDPPYQTGLIKETLGYLEKNVLLSDEGILILQHSTRESIQELLSDCYELTDQRRGGDTTLSFCRLNQKEKNN